MALGAQPSAVLGMIRREGSIMLLSGVGLGLLLAIGSGRILSSILYGVGALHPIAFATAPVLLAAAALLASWVPARRATRVNPVIALRTE
jgi:putative ABC transport system permease protein